MRLRQLVRLGKLGLLASGAVAVGAAAIGAGGAQAAGPAIVPHAFVPAVSHRPLFSLGANQSSNWSGYNQGALEKNTNFQGVAGDWVVPTATEKVAGEAEYSSTWVGIGGGCIDAGCATTDSTLIQTGTEQDAGNTGGPAYYGWWEIIPAPSFVATDANGNTLPVSAGDAMHATVTQTAPQVWTILLQDTTKGWTFTQTVPYSSSYATAEWIEETPVVISNSGSVTVGPLPKLSTVHIDNAQTAAAAGGPLAGAGLVPGEEIQLVDPNSGQVLATPSSPDPDADGFNDCTFATTCAAPSGDLGTSGGGGTGHHKLRRAR